MAVDCDREFRTVYPIHAKYAFQDEQLDHILHAINLRQTEIHLQSSPELGKHVLTVSFSEDSPEKMAELIGLALNLKCTRNQNIITLSE